MVTAWPARNFSDLEPPTYTASVPVASALAFTFLVVFIVGYLHDVASTTRRARSPSMIESGGRVLRRSVIDVRTTSLTLCKSPLRGPLAPRPARRSTERAARGRPRGPRSRRARPRARPGPRAQAAQAPTTCAIAPAPARPVGSRQLAAGRRALPGAPAAPWRACHCRSRYGYQRTDDE